MLTPSDKTIIIARALEVLDKAEGVGTSMIEDMAQLLADAKEEEIVYHMEQEEEMKAGAEITEGDIDDMSAYWEQHKDDFIQNQIDIRRGK